MRLTAVLLLGHLAMIAAISSGCKSNEKMPALNQVEMKSNHATVPAFEFSNLEVQNVNGKLNIAIVSKQGGILQINDLPLSALKNGKVAADAYRLVYLPGGFQSACLGNAAKNRLSLQQRNDNAWELSLRGEISCGTDKIGVKLRTNIAVPAPTFVAPNQP